MFYPIRTLLGVISVGCLVFGIVSLVTCGSMVGIQGAVPGIILILASIPFGWLSRKIRF